MLFEKKVPVTLVPARNFQKELEYLYARRCAIDGLIQSLEDYTRFRADKIARQDKRRTA